MAKRNKAKFAAKSRKSALRIEALEQRQLLATIVGGGIDAGSNITHPNGNVYDQVLMTGSSVTVTADPGQVTRVSFLDKSGDILQAEFAGSGTLNISLSDFGAAAPAAEYNQPGVNYVSGNATFTIQGSDANTNFSVFSVGPGNAINQTLFTGGKDGGNNVADVQAIVIVNNPANPGGFTNFGGIRAGNAVFSGSSGNVGITATGVNVQGPVIIGDVNASDVGVPVLNFGANSQFNTLVVAGGDLVQANNALILGGTAAGIQSINFTAGATSLVESRPGFTTGAPDMAAQVNSTGDIFNGAEPTIATLDATTAFTITGKTQTELNAFFNGRTFQNDVTITGDLAAGFTLAAAEFRGNVTITGNVAGVLDTTTTAAGKGFNAGLTVTGNLSGSVTTNNIGSLTVGGALSGAVLATDSATANIGSVSLGSVAEGRVVANGSIGNVLVSGNVTGDGAGNGYVFRTNNATATNPGNIGTVTIGGDVNLDTSTSALVWIDGIGNFGNITISGGGTLGSTTAGSNVGAIVVDNFGAGSPTTGWISITDTVDINFGGVIIGSGGVAQGTLGDITITGGDAVDTDLLVSGRIGGVTAGSDLITLGKVTVSKFNDIEFNNDDVYAAGDVFVGTKVGDISISTIAGTTTGGKQSTIALTDFVTLNSGSSSVAETVGTLTIDAKNSGGSTVTLADLVAFATASNGSIGNIAITAATTNWSGALEVKTIGDIKVTGAGNITGNIGGASNTTIGKVEVTGAATVGAIIGGAANTAIGDITHGGNVNFTTANGGYRSLGTAGTIGNVSVTGTTTSAALNTNALQATNIGTQNYTGNFTNAASGLTFETITGTAGAITFGGTAAIDSTTGSAFKLGSSTGALTFNGVATFTNNGTNASFHANNNTSAVDMITSITHNALVVGAAGVEYRASAIGDITVQAALSQGQSLATDLTVVAVNNTHTTAGSAETVATDGSNVASYSLGNIKVQSTNTIGVTSTALFNGSNSFQALGNVGTIQFLAGGSAAVQTKLFEGTGTDLAQVRAGSADRAGSANFVGVDFDGDGTIGSNTFNTNIAVAWETNSDYQSNKTVTIGAITINATGDFPGNANDKILNVGGGSSGADGLLILGAVKNGANFDNANLAVIDGNLFATVGTITVQNLAQQLSVNTGDNLNPAHTVSGVIAVNGNGTGNSIGSINGNTFAFNTDTDAAIVGGSNTTADVDEIVVIRL